jgi:hypothetical protein
MTNYDKSFDTQNFHVEVSTQALYGWFEHNDLGDECGGGLWFEGNKLIDYDGVFELPKEVADVLAINGYDVEEMR